ncbi:hypothetical protein A3841_17350 [Pontibacter flavimaris]|uniref:Uncharacterized protein n=1 Tax=Pontibacter flavimaris TaxID=1797110 RepID=A0A1Q5PD32_9BACT|nr:hypothetical protein A3841_17350 [Pontibacter flavimaris]
MPLHTCTFRFAFISIKAGYLICEWLWLIALDREMSRKALRDRTARKRMLTPGTHTLKGKPTKATENNLVPALVRGRRCVYQQPYQLRCEQIKPIYLAFIILVYVFANIFSIY